MDKSINMVLGGLQDLILHGLRNAANEQYNPQANPDMSDNVIADGLERAKKLRVLREEFENTVTGAILRD